MSGWAVAGAEEVVGATRAVMAGGGEFDGFRGWVNREKVLPLLADQINAFLAAMGGFEVRIGMLDDCTPEFFLCDRGATVSYDYASGFQKFAIGLAARVALARIGAAGHNLRHLFIDEGFVACDADNLGRVAEVLQAVKEVGGYRSVLIISHLEAVAGAVSVTAEVRREEGATCSALRFGAEPM